MAKFNNILLINAWEGEILPPPAIGYLQAAIKHHFGNTVNVYARDLTAALSLLKTEHFDLVAVSFHSFSVKYAGVIRSAVDNNTWLVCGGHHPSILPMQLINLGYNQVIVGEGENAIIDVIEGNGNSILIDNDREYYKSVSDYPFPEYTGLMGQWQNNNTEFGYPIISSRGCPFACNFCASSIFWNRKTYMRSPENVIAEIIHNIETLGMKSWIFEDDNFTLSKSRVTDMCNKIITEVIPKYGKNSWQCASRAEVLADTELCKLLKDAGCAKIWLGIESFSQASLDRCNKNTTVEKMITGIETAENSGLKTMCQFIIGLPGDSEADILQTAKIIKTTKISNLGGNVAWVLPGTAIHTKAKQQGFNDNIYLESGTPFYTFEHSIETLNNWNSIINNAKK